MAVDVRLRVTREGSYQELADLRDEIDADVVRYGPRQHVRRIRSQVEEDGGMFEVLWEATSTQVAETLVGAAAASALRLGLPVMPWGDTLLVRDSRDPKLRLFSHAALAIVAVPGAA